MWADYKRHIVIIDQLFKNTHRGEQTIKMYIIILILYMIKQLLTVSIVCRAFIVLLLDE